MDHFPDKRLQPGDIALAWGLLTRLPVPPALPDPDPERPIAASGWAWPLIGGGLGAVAGLVGLIALGLGVPAGVAAGLALVVLVAATGALHEDGLADCADGFWGGNSPERRREIMKDSRIGAYGTLALILALLLRWSALAALFGAGWVVAPLIAAGALARAPLPMMMALVPNARDHGLSHGAAARTAKRRGWPWASRP